MQPAPEKYWQDLNVASAYLDFLGEQFGIKTLDDWLSIPQAAIPKIETITRVHGGLAPLLRKLYPHHQWKSQAELSANVTGKAGKGQIRLFDVTRSMFPSSNILLNYIHPKLTFKNTLIKMEFDVYVEDLKLAFEYEGEQHYHWTYLRGSPDSQRALDDEKQEACKREGITLIQIPYWWDK